MFCQQGCNPTEVLLPLRFAPRDQDDNLYLQALETVPWCFCCHPQFNQLCPPKPWRRRIQLIQPIQLTSPQRALAEFYSLLAFSGGRRPEDRRALLDCTMYEIARYSIFEVLCSFLYFAQSHTSHNLIRRSILEVLPPLRFAPRLSCLR